MSVTDEQLAEWERLADGATPGPWVQRRKPAGRYGSGEQWHVNSEAADAGCVSCRLSDGPEAEPDAAFIAAARTAVPELIAEVERLRDETERLRSALGDACARLLDYPPGVVTAVALRNPKSACACAPPPARHLPDCPHFAPEGA